MVEAGTEIRGSREDAGRKWKKGALIAGSALAIAGTAFFAGKMMGSRGEVRIAAGGHLITLPRRDFATLMFASAQAGVHPSEYASLLARFAEMPDSAQKGLVDEIADRADSVRQRMATRPVAPDSLNGYLDALKRDNILRTFNSMQELGRQSWGNHPQMWENIKRQIRELVAAEKAAKRKSGK